MDVNSNKPGKAPVVYMNGADEMKLTVRKASDVVDRPQEWLWEGFIPYETCTLIAGVPGIGKSQFLMWLASAVSNGAEFKLNSLPFKMPEGSVLIVACEDSEDTGIVPRLKALKANLDKIHLLRCVQSVVNPKNKRLIGLDTDTDLLEELIEQIGDVKLIIIDPISGFSGQTRDHIDSQVRNLLNKINDLAAKHKIAIVLNKHLRKPKGDGIGAAINEVAGSGAWVAVVRQAFVIAPHHEDESLILFSDLKANLKAKSIESFGYRIQSHHYVSESGEPIQTSHLAWTNEVIKISADEALSKGVYEEKSKTAQVKEYIFNRLKDGSCGSKQLIEECISKFEVTDKIVYRIKNQLKIEASGSTRGGTCWFLTPDSPDNI